MNRAKVCLSFAVLSLWCVTALAQTRFERLRVIKTEIKPGMLAGSGIEPREFSFPLADSKGNAITWRVKRDEVDRLGMRHVFFEQVVETPAGSALIAGTDVGVHYTEDGSLHVIAGQQVRSLLIQNELRFGPAEASSRILSALRRDTPAGLTSGHFKALGDPSIVVLTNDGMSRLAYEVLVQDGASLPFRVAIDASLDQIVRVVPEFAGGNCEPTTPLMIESATGIPLRDSDGVPDRPLTANKTGGRPAPGSILTHEAFRPAQSNSPAILTFQQTEDPAFQCVQTSTRFWTLFPVRSPGGTPTFDDFSDEWRGREAGDAMYHTMRTMEAFYDLGRNGWDGGGGNANIMVHAFHISADNSFFVNATTDENPIGVLVTPRSQITYGLEAALDMIAHEWGHGVVYSSSGMQNIGVQAQLHEGFGDVIGHAVERLMQPPGFGLEQGSDWDIAEDAGVPGGYLRRANQDDGSGPMKYHRDDGFHEGSPHAYGNMLAVALYVLSDGGTNPWCGNNPGKFGCDAFSAGIDYLGSRVLFRTLTHYVTSTTIWEDLAFYARFATWDLLRDCSASVNRNAEWEQEQVEQAFKSIGYPSGAAPFEGCPDIP